MTFVLSPGHTDESTAVAVESGDLSVPGTAGLRVYIDPETGDITDAVDPNVVAELDPDTENALRHDGEGLITKRHANGAESLDLEGRYQEAYVLTIDKNGKRTFCSSNAAGIEQGLNEKTSTTTTPGVK